MLAAAVVTTALRAGASPLGWPTLAVAVAGPGSCWAADTVWTGITSPRSPT
jgi:hypothetical protein